MQNLSWYSSLKDLDIWLIIVNFQMQHATCWTEPSPSCLIEMQWLTENAKWKKVYVPRQNFCGFTDFLMTDVFCFFSLYFLMTLPWIFGQKTFSLLLQEFVFPLWEWIAWVACLLMPILFLSIQGSSFFCHHLWLFSYPRWCLPAKETLLHNWWRGRLLGLSVSI